MRIKTEGEVLTSKEEKSAQDHDGLFNRLLKRHVVQAAAIYLAVAWGAVEILITLQEKLGWPETISIWATRLFVVGFPVAVILAWRRDLESRAARFGLVTLALVAASVALWLTLSTDPVPRAPTATQPPVNETVATVVILPFENGSGDPAYDYLANGFTGELIGRLSKHPDLAIVQQESVQSPLLMSLLPVAKAATLKADFMVQGRVLREDKFIEVNASLQDLDGIVLWSEILREPYAAASILSMQRRISGEVSRALGTTLHTTAYCGETADLEAMELYYRGRFAVGTRQIETMEEGIELLKKAVEQDPYFGRAWNQLGSAQMVMSSRVADPGNPNQDRRRAGVLFSMSLSGLRRALDICPTLGWAYKVLVPNYEGIDNNSINQEMQWRDALAMDPNDAAMLRQYAFHLMQHGMHDEAIEVLRRAYDNEPMLAMIPAQLANVFSKNARCTEALPTAEEGEQLGGMSSAAVEMACAMHARDLERLISASTTLSKTGGGGPNPFEALGMSVEDVSRARLESDDPLRPVLQSKMRAIWEATPDFRESVDFHWIVSMATDIGDLDLVFEMLDSVVRPWGFNPYALAYAPLFDSAEASGRLRADPRFAEILNKTDLPGYWRKYGWPNGCEADGDSFLCF